MSGAFSADLLTASITINYDEKIFFKFTGCQYPLW